MQSDNTNLHLFTRERIKYIINNNPNEIIQLIHPIVNPDGTPMLCECGLMYTEESRVEEGTCSLYTLVGVAHIKYYGLKCNMNKCEKKFCDVSGTFGMFFYTNTTCAGDEIGWDFINAVKTSKISFTGFCNQMTRVYKTTYSDAQAFMSVKTLIGWFFGGCQRSRLIPANRSIHSADTIPKYWCAMVHTLVCLCAIFDWIIQLQNAIEKMYKFLGFMAT